MAPRGFAGRGSEYLYWAGKSDREKFECGVDYFEVSIAVFGSELYWGIRADATKLFAGDGFGATRGRFIRGDVIKEENEGKEKRN